jgi:hypothetical protein
MWNPGDGSPETLRASRQVRERTSLVRYLPDIRCPNGCELEEGGHMTRGCLSDKEFLAKLFLNEKGLLYIRTKCIRMHEQLPN